jgi:hypothetical protein
MDNNADVFFLRKVDYKKIWRIPVGKQREEWIPPHRHCRARIHVQIYKCYYYAQWVWISCFSRSIFRFSLRSFFAVDVYTSILDYTKYLKDTARESNWERVAESSNSGCLKKVSMFWAPSCPRKSRKIWKAFYNVCNSFCTFKMFYRDGSIGFWRRERDRLKLR